jgi:hypothetical protein
MCGYGEIDGHTFCLGLDRLGINIEPSTSMVNTLIRGATFRPKKQASDQGRLHLDIGRLGELVDAYHAHKATERHDKIFALLGMSSDAIGVGDLRPDYQTPWETLLRRLVMFLLGNQVSISTWESKEIAIVLGKGRVLGHIDFDQRQNESIQTIVPCKSYSRESDHAIWPTMDWPLQSSAKPIKQKDIICHVQGAENFTIVRPCNGYFAIINIAPKFSEYQKAKLFQLSLESVVRDLPLIWNWEKLSEESQVSGEYDAISSPPKSELEARLAQPTRTWNLHSHLETYGGIVQRQRDCEKQLQNIRRYSGSHIRKRRKANTA